MSERRWASSVGLEIIVRDVDQPDSLISDARAIVEPMSARSAAPLTATSDTAGLAGFVVPDSGEYHVRVLRLGYDRLEFRVRLEADCHHVLEAYLSRAVGLISDPMYTAVGKEPKTVGKEPKRTRTPARTRGRAVLTTCPPAA
jgi:hypothetical protein